eukprot:TRINITY_DN12524_c0_g1_i1.p2 TRINITY_DN12524_c0_g1~~TRINITY_DN12524_c0_g1_i1.p2  ORF type:complete len:238 (+),score=64.07 TRINITY_DN12524_c0_g1_i1:787-1500(+)
MRALLSDRGFRAEELVLTDDDQSRAPTRANIVSSMEWLVSGSRAGDSLFLHFSGHGVEVKEDPAEECAQALLPVDFRSTRPFQVLMDDEVGSILLQLAPGARLTVVCDCCHAGAMMDLPFSIRCCKDPGLREDEGTLEVAEREGHAEFGCDIIMLSASRDSGTHQTPPSMAGTGALTHAFIGSLYRDTNPTFEHMLMDMRNTLQRRLGALCPVPMLSCSRRVSASERFRFGATDRHS